jgi:ribosomal protein S18 acetylase RimI-like enzyme
MNDGVTLRDAEPRDRDLLLRLYASTRRLELAAVPWTPEQKAAFVEQQFSAQDLHYHKEFPGAQFSVIQHQGCDAGRVYITREHGIHMLDLTVLAEYRGRGIGGAVVRRLQQEARQQGSALTVYVEVFNPALPWFEKRGFRAQQQNEPAIHVLMKWMPAGHLEVAP